MGSGDVGRSGDGTDASVVEAAAGKLDVAGKVEVVRVGRFLEAGMLSMANGFLCFIYALFNVTLYLVSLGSVHTHSPSHHSGTCTWRKSSACVSRRLAI